MRPLDVDDDEDTTPAVAAAAVVTPAPELSYVPTLNQRLPVLSIRGCRYVLDVCPYASIARLSRLSVLRDGLPLGILVTLRVTTTVCSEPEPEPEPEPDPDRDPEDESISSEQHRLVDVLFASAEASFACLRHMPFQRCLALCLLHPCDRNTVAVPRIIRIAHESVTRDRCSARYMLDWRFRLAPSLAPC